MLNMLKKVKDSVPQLGQVSLMEGKGKGTRRGYLDKRVRKF